MTPLRSLHISLPPLPPPRVSRAAQAIQSWSEEFKVQLASGGADAAEEEEVDEGAEEEEDAADAQALLDFAEAIEHR